MILYRHEVDEQIYGELESAYYEYESHKHILDLMIQNQQTNIKLLQDFEKLHREALRKYHKLRAKIIRTTIPEILGDNRFSWNVDFISGDFTVRYKGAEEPDLPESYERIG